MDAVHRPEITTGEKKRKRVTVGTEKETEEEEKGSTGILPFGPHAQQVPPDFFSSLRDSHTTENIDTLRQRLKTEGYLLMRGLHDQHQVEKAAHRLLTRLATKGLVINNDEHKLDEGYHTGKPTSAGSRTHLDLQDEPDFSAIFKQGSNVQQFLSELLEGPAISFDFKFLRCVPPKAGTPIHCDNVSAKCVVGAALIRI